MRISDYGSIPRRTLEAAIVHRLETEYKILGSHRILTIIAEDLVALVDQFHQPQERLKQGDLLWTTTMDEGQRARVGKRTEDYASITVVLPLFRPEDIAHKEHPRTPEGRAQAGKDATRRMVRVIKAAAEQGGLLTLAELAVIFNSSPAAVRCCLARHYDDTRELLPLKGLLMD